MKKDEIKQIILKWLKKNITRKDIKDIRHIYSMSYVIGYAAPGCIVVSNCWCQSEPQNQDFTRTSPLDVIRTFDNSLKPGDWCISAYVIYETMTDTVAVPIPYVEKKYHLKKTTSGITKSYKYH